MATSTAGSHLVQSLEHSRNRTGPVRCYLYRNHVAQGGDKLLMNNGHLPYRLKDYLAGGGQSQGDVWPLDLRQKRRTPSVPGKSFNVLSLAVAIDHLYNNNSGIPCQPRKE